jgi:hypothetical protein
MKNNLSIVLVLSVFISLVLGCGLSSGIQKAVEGDKTSKTGTSNGDDKSLEDKAIETIADGETTGVPECDEVISIINKQTESKDDDWMSKAAKGYVFGQIKKSIKESIEKNKEDKVKMAEQCKDMKKSVEKAIAEEKVKAKE